LRLVKRRRGSDKEGGKREGDKREESIKVRNMGNKKERIDKKMILCKILFLIIYSNLNSL
jgi:hypothetical protein